MGRQVGRNARLWAGLTNGGKAVPVGSTKQFGASFKRKTIDASCQGDDGEVMFTGLRGGSGTYSGIFNDTEAAAAIAAALDGQSRNTDGYLSAALTAYFYCTALFDVDFDSTVDGMVEVKGSWVADTPLYYVGVS